jgi:hypothetical protein
VQIERGRSKLQMFYPCGALRRNAIVVVTNDVIIVESFVACMGDNDGKCFAVRGIYIGVSVGVSRWSAE